MDLVSFLGRRGRGCGAAAQSLPIPSHLTTDLIAGDCDLRLLAVQRKEKIKVFFPFPTKKGRMGKDFPPSSFSFPAPCHFWSSPSFSLCLSFCCGIAQVVLLPSLAGRRCSFSSLPFLSFPLPTTAAAAELLQQLSSVFHPSPIPFLFLSPLPPPPPAASQLRKVLLPSLPFPILQGR